MTDEVGSKQTDITKTFFVNKVWSSFIPENCPDGHFSVDGRCISCFCAGVSKNCKRTGRYRNQISLRFTEAEDYKGTSANHFLTNKEPCRGILTP